MRKLFAIISYGLLLLSLINTIFLNLPPELQERLLLTPEIAWLLAIVSGGVGSGGLAVLEVLKGFEKRNDTKVNMLIENHLSDKKEQKETNQRITALEKTNDQLLKAINRLINLQEVDLQSKLSNPFIEKKVKELIEGELDESE